MKDYGFLMISYDYEKDGSINKIVDQYVNTYFKERECNDDLHKEFIEKYCQNTVSQCYENILLGSQSSFKEFSFKIKVLGDFSFELFIRFNNIYHYVTRSSGYE